jgi:truncated hemoglobin YjbI
MSEPPTLYEWVKGRPAIARLIDAFYDRVERDDLRGPADYTQRLGGYPAMLAHHRDLGITPEQRFRFASLMSLAAPARTSSSRRRCPAGAGASRRPTSVNGIGLAGPRPGPVTLRS